MNPLEQEILSSFLAYPQYLEEFLSEVPRECFSKDAQEVLNILQDLPNISLNVFTQSLNKAQSEKAFILEMLSTLPNPNVLLLKEPFIKAYNLDRQRRVAQELLLASENNTLLDIDQLLPNLQTKSYKNFAQWQEYYATKPVMPKFETGVSFLDSALNGGIECAQLVLISGDPEAGKTTLGLQMLEHISKKHKVCFFSFEFPIYQYLKAKDTKKGFNANNLIIIDDGYELYNIAQNIKTLYKSGVRVFLIDSQMRISSPNGRNMEEEESLKFSTLAKLCHSLNIVVFLIVQTSKGDRDNPMGSKKGGHESSITIRIEHDKAENEKIREFSENSRIVILKKNKQTGKHYKERVHFDAQKRIFSSMPTSYSIYEEVIIENIF
ncbi:RAD55 family ATPase [Helicobacter himalayensis]|uniref:RAD55 family ATPase n=1 Tax=Helicobacter himalayensis TaxID=1591088 RepID=UPI000834F84D|nr:ATPase domain-containing protein [Helicobacter himalayensis]